MCSRFSPSSKLRHGYLKDTPGGKSSSRFGRSNDYLTPYAPRNASPFLRASGASLLSTIATSRGLPANALRSDTARSNCTHSPRRQFAVRALHTGGTVFRSVHARPFRDERPSLLRGSPLQSDSAAFRSIRTGPSAWIPTTGALPGLKGVRFVSGERVWRDAGSRLKTHSRCR